MHFMRREKERKADNGFMTAQASYITLSTSQMPMLLALFWSAHHQLICDSIEATFAGAVFRQAKQAHGTLK